MCGRAWVHAVVWCGAQAIPAAHTGFLSRARAIRVEHLYELAQSQRKRLVLCGHSLGGSAVCMCVCGTRISAGAHVGGGLGVTSRAGPGCCACTCTSPRLC